VGVFGRIIIRGETVRQLKVTSGKCNLVQICGNGEKTHDYYLVICGDVKLTIVYRRFGGAHRLHLEGHV
jgi:hypothetical protein